MKYLIIPDNLVEKIRNMEFPKPHVLEPVKGEIDGKEVYFLRAELKTNPIFSKVFADFEACEVKEIDKIEEKLFDSKGFETTDTEKITTTKVILSVAKELIKTEESKSIIASIGEGIVDGATAVWNGIVYVWDGITGWFKS
jgi:hypothetical protein